MKIIFMLPNGFIEWEVPEGQRANFSLGALATRIRCDGYLLAENLYVRHDQIIGMSISAESGGPRMHITPGTTLQ